ncbi:uncharacterized protein LOC135475259 isoform X2 [Liolophura sinensis]|uniref:uncharacterized protein LOC135475259 isoform X2 n=1 Tax=Liolophura sinensis TaxID=3198878 RepID=UPI003158D904
MSGGVTVSFWSSVIVSLMVSVLAVWRPKPGTSWQWQLSGGKIDTHYNVDMYDVDLYDTSSSDLNALKAAGKIVICYFSAGTKENYRSDAGQFPHAAIGHKLEDWPDEHWIDIRHPMVREIMSRRLDHAKTRNCDGVEPDNVDGYTNNNGLGLRASDQLEYNKWLAGEAHKRGLSVGLKNDVDQIHELASYFDWALNEECVNYNECGKYSSFLQQNKAVFHTEYVDHKTQGVSKQHSVCSSSKRPHGFSTLIKDWDLDSWRLAC